MSDIVEPKRNVILYIGAFELPDKNAAAQRVLSNAKLFQSLGYEVVLIGRTRSGELSDGEIRKTNYPDIEFECWETAYPKSTREWFRQIISVSNIQAAFEARLKGRLFALGLMIGLMVHSAGIQDRDGAPGVLNPFSIPIRGCAIYLPMVDMQDQNCVMLSRAAANG